MYYLIFVSEDGELDVSKYTKEEILKLIDEGEGFYKFWDKIPPSDPMEWEKNSLLIKGELVTPFPVNVVTEYDIK